jgi:tetraacyldisaccharide 4'-kinase
VKRQILRALSYGYLGATVARNWLYDRGHFGAYRSALPVLSIGNVTAGGNGKTPLVVFLVSSLRARGYSPVILSRGYGGANSGPLRVRSDHDPMEVGDEPVLLHRCTGAPVYIARKRADGARLIEQERAGDVIVLDDAFQHRSLARDLDIVSVSIGNPDAVDSFIDGEVLPLGLFREDRDQALRRADMIVLSERKVYVGNKTLPPVDPRALRVLPPEVPVFRSFLLDRGVFALMTESQVSPQPVIAFAGIAHPEGFFESLEGLGFPILRKGIFPDHYRVTEQDLTQLLLLHPSAIAVCTEKDEVKCTDLPASIRERLAVLRTEPRVVPSDAFLVAVERGMQRR